MEQNIINNLVRMDVFVYFKIWKSFRTPYVRRYIQKRNVGVKGSNENKIYWL